MARKHPTNRETKSQTGCVYFVRDPETNLVKIGCTCDLKTRLKTLGGELLFAIPADDHFTLERYFHRKFSHRQVRAEWFGLQDVDVEEASREFPVLVMDQLPPQRYSTAQIETQLLCLARKASHTCGKSLSSYLSDLLREPIKKDYERLHGFSEDSSPKSIPDQVTQIPSFKISLDKSQGFGEKLRLLRQSISLTQGELARAAGLDPSALSLLEAGKREPSFETACKLARALGVELNDLRSF